MTSVQREGTPNRGQKRANRASGASPYARLSRPTRDGVGNRIDDGVGNIPADLLPGFMVVGNLERRKRRLKQVRLSQLSPRSLDTGG